MRLLPGFKTRVLLVYHGDEPLLRDRLENFTGNVKTFGRSEKNDLYPIEINQSDKGSSFKIKGESEPFYLPVLGTHNVLNALAAMLTANYLGIPFDKMNAGFASLKLTNMRMELVVGKNGEKIINDAYNASPTSMKAAIELISNLTGYQKKILVLGDMLELGPKEDEFHYTIGQIAGS